VTPRDVKRLRRRLGMTQAQFGDLVGVAANTVARWERGELGMKATTARLISILVAGETGRKRAATRKRP
jgi:DNA-binding transcriptional regulator YiaG